MPTSIYANGECPNCGNPLTGDGFKTVLHCENANPDSYADHEPDAQPVFCESPDQPTAPPDYAPFTGKLVRAGTFPCRDEEITGVAIEMTVDELRAVKHLPMYRRVTVSVKNSAPDSSPNSAQLPTAPVPNDADLNCAAKLFQEPTATWDGFYTEEEVASIIAARRDAAEAPLRAEIASLVSVIDGLRDEINMLTAKGWKDSADFTIAIEKLTRERAALLRDNAQDSKRLELNDDTRFILGMPCFEAAPYAHKLKKLKVEGFVDLEPKAEAEQAAVLHWMLNLYLQHGESWRDAGKKILSATPAVDAAMTAQEEART